MSLFTVTRQFGNIKVFVKASALPDDNNGELIATFTSVFADDMLQVFIGGLKSHHVVYDKTNQQYLRGSIDDLVR